MENRSKSILGIIHSPPFGSSVHEAIELLMVYAAYDFEVSILLKDSAVLHLQQEKRPELLKLKDQSAILAAIELYDVKSLLVDKNAFEQYQCKAADNFHFELLNDAMIKDALSSYSEVVNL